MTERYVILRLNQVCHTKIRPQPLLSAVQTLEPLASSCQNPPPFCIEVVAVETGYGYVALDRSRETIAVTWRRRGATRACST